MDQIFRFKQFNIQQDKSAMKIGTDGVLLGAWTDISFQPESILDIGSGTGLIGLMMAQRSQAELIDAVELDENAYEQSVENFENSIWNDRLFCYHADFLAFAEEMKGEHYDLILSNPPFFDLPKKETEISEARQKARFQESLNDLELISGVADLLSPEGLFSIIIPFASFLNFIEIAKTKNLFPRRITHVRGRAESEVKRSLIQFGFGESNPIKNELTIEVERHHYTSEYIELTKDFYLKM